MRASDPQACRCCLTTKTRADFYPSYKSQCRACLKTKAFLVRESKLKYLAQWRASNPNAAKDWYLENRERKHKYNAQWYAANRDGERTRYDLWRKQNSGIVNALIAKRNAAKKRQTPPWANHAAIRVIYEKATRMTKETGIRWDVDHIIPLQGETVSGLHWEGNLQLLPKTENIRKSNRLLAEHLPC